MWPHRKRRSNFPRKAHTKGTAGGAKAIPVTGQQPGGKAAGTREERVPWWDPLLLYAEPSVAALESFRTGLAGADSDDFLDRRDEDLSVSDTVGTRCFRDGIDQVGYLVVVDDSDD